MIELAELDLAEGASSVPLIRFPRFAWLIAAGVTVPTDIDRITRSIAARIDMNTDRTRQHVWNEDQYERMP